MTYPSVKIQGEKFFIVPEEDMARLIKAEEQHYDYDKRTLRKMIAARELTIAILEGEQAAPPGHRLFIGPMPYKPKLVEIDQPEEPF